jgi:hypothetical protein
MRQYFTLGAVAMIAVACGGVSSIGDGKGNVDGKDGGGSGGETVSTGGGSSSGAQTGSGGDVGKGGDVGQGGAGGLIGTGAAPGAGGNVGAQCKSAAECAAPQYCAICPGGITSCASADCIGGKCEVVPPGCPVGGSGGAGGFAGGSGGSCAPEFCPIQDPKGKPCCMSGIGPCGMDYGQGCVSSVGVQCVTDKDCPIPPVPCKPCPDGSCAQALTQCVKNQCQTSMLDCAPATPQWWSTCGPPVCSANIPPSGLPPCGTMDKTGNPCAKPGLQCDTGDPCVGPLTCATSNPSPNTCPVSRAKYKQDIEYVSRDERAKLASDIQSIPLVRYRYKDGPEREHLGFIIEDIEPSPSVDSKHDQVDLYGYTSMAVAALQQQHAEIEALKHEVESLKAALRRGHAK